MQDNIRTLTAQIEQLLN